MKRVGILAHSAEGASLCFRAFCQEGFRRLGRLHLDPRHPVRSVQRLAGAGADSFVCPDNTAHMALEQPGEDLALPGLHIAEVVADQVPATAARARHRAAGGAGLRRRRPGVHRDPAPGDARRLFPTHAGLHPPSGRRRLRCCRRQSRNAVVAGWPSRRVTFEPSG
jgi:hypothetical protein